MSSSINLEGYSTSRASTIAVPTLGPTLQVEQGLVGTTEFKKEDIDMELVVSIELQLKKREYLLKKSGHRRKAFVLSTPIMYSVGASLGSAISKSTLQVGGMSVAAANALNHLNMIIQQSEGKCQVSPEILDEDGTK